MPVELRIPIPDAAKSGDAVQVYTDFGTGTIDMAQPLLAEPAPVFASGQRRALTAKDYSAKGSARTGRPPARLREATGSISDFKKGPKNAFQPFLEVVVRVPAYYGNHKFAAQMVDSAGNAQGGTLPEITVFLSSPNPPGVRSFELAGYDAGLNQVTFNVTRNSE